MLFRLYSAFVRGSPEGNSRELEARRAIFKYTGTDSDDCSFEDEKILAGIGRLENLAKFSLSSLSNDETT